MVAETSAYRFLSCAFQVLYKDREAQLRGNPPDMLSGLEMKPLWQDPSQRFLPPDFQDFWICQDVQAAFYHIGRRAYTSFPATTYCNPTVQYTPQVANYTHYESHAEPYRGTYVKYLSYRLTYDSFYYGAEAYQVMSCDSDAPGLLSTIGPQLTYVGNQGGNPFTYRANSKVWSTISNDMETGDVSLFSDLSVEGHPASAYMPLQSPAYTVALSSALAAHKRKIFSVGNYYSCCFSPPEAEITVFNNGGVFDYMWCFLNDSETSCCNMRYQQRYLTSDYQITYYNHAHRIQPWQEVEWFNGHIDGTYHPRMYRQYLYSETAGGIPVDDKFGKNYRLYAQAPLYCFYGNLSADVYLMWRANFYDGSPEQFYARKLEVEFERSDYFCSGQHPHIARYALRSKQTWSYDEIFCVWKPLAHDAIKGVVNNLRAMAGLSAWQFPTGVFPEDEEDIYAQHSVNVSWESPFIIWKFSHPLIEEPGYHFTNQDEPA